MPTQLHVKNTDNKLCTLSSEYLKPVGRLDELDWCKPMKGGLWTSTLIKGSWSSWCEWTKHENFKYVKNGDAYVLNVAPQAKIFEISTRSDLDWLIERYTSENKLFDGADRYFIRLNWEKLQEDFDAVHFSQDGVKNLLRNYSRDGTRYNVSMSAWDAESTVWFRWKFIDSKPIKISDPEDPEDKTVWRNLPIVDKNNNEKTTIIAS